MKTEALKKITDMSILVVDDEDWARKLMEKTLRNANYTNIKCAAGGREALHILGFKDERAPADASFDLVLLDIALPDISGFDVCRLIKNSGLEIPVILVSCMEIDDVYDRILEGDDFISKPINGIELITRVQLILQKREKNIYKDIDASLQRDQSLPGIGDVVSGYSVMDTLGWGNSTVVYEVLDKNNGELYAMKILTKYASTFRDIATRFDNERKIMSMLSHPNIIKYVNSGDYNGLPYIVMEYVKGVDFEDFLAAIDVHIPLEVILKIAIELSTAISELHKNEIIHRDIKPKNLLYNTESGDIKLADFGISKLPDSPHVTRDGLVMGTPVYLAPEVFRGDSATIFSDIYSFGATIYHLVMGRPPFLANDSIELYEKHNSAEPDRISSFRNDLPEELDELIVGQCLAKNPFDRPGAMEEVEKKLSEILDRNVAVK